MMSHGHRPLLIVLLLLLVFSGGVRTQEEDVQLWADVPIWLLNFNQLVAMSREAVDEFNRRRSLLRIPALIYCRTEEAQKQTQKNAVFYALTILAGENTCNPFTLIACRDNVRAYKAVVARMHDKRGFILQSFIYLPWYTPRYYKKCI
ncbi:hypothetical protein AXF42_Ash015781 [Apostasia shenzhenica]|uniref:Cystatin domain-containing protein n=1 Tax=Apostasia shenzhenica TaxID=1088818 RepID=A0A2H9ZXI8_9ASPA|nr:hypothetical protein AXF42_Ash015781 [Apostasia shenzhenica]